MEKALISTINYEFRKARTLGAKDIRPRKRRKGMRVGDTVYHPRWGSGEVTEVSEGKVKATYKMRSGLSSDWKHLEHDPKDFHEHSQVIRGKKQFTMFSEPELNKGQAWYFPEKESEEEQGIRERRAYEEKEMGRVRPFQRVKRGKLEFVRGHERKPSIGGTSPGTKKKEISDPTKSHPYVGQEKPTQQLADRVYPDAASEKTSERAMREVGGDEYRPSDKDLAKQNLKIKIVALAREIAKQRGGLITMLEATQEAEKQLKEQKEYKPFVELEDLPGGRQPLSRGRSSGWKNPTRVTDFSERRFKKGDGAMDEKKVKKALVIDPLNLFVRVVEVPDDDLQKAEGGGLKGRPGLQPKKVQVKGQRGGYQAIRYVGQPGQPAGPQKLGAAGEPPEAGQPPKGAPGPSSFDQPAQEGDRIMIEGRHAIVTSSGEHGVTAHDAEGTKYQKFHGDYEHYGKKDESEGGGPKFDFGEKGGEGGKEEPGMGFQPGRTKEEAKKFAETGEAKDLEEKPQGPHRDVEHLTKIAKKNEKDRKKKLQKPEGEAYESGLKDGDKVVDEDGKQGTIVGIDSENDKNFKVDFDGEEYSIHPSHLEKTKEKSAPSGPKDMADSKVVKLLSQNLKLTDKKGGPVTVVIHGKRMVVSYGGHRFDASLGVSGKWTSTKSGPGKEKTHMSSGLVVDELGKRRTMTDEQAHKVIQSIFEEAKKGKVENPTKTWDKPGESVPETEESKEAKKEHVKETFGKLGYKKKEEPEEVKKSLTQTELVTFFKSDRPIPDSLFVLEDW